MRGCIPPTSRGLLECLRLHSQRSAQPVHRARKNQRDGLLVRHRHPEFVIFLNARDRHADPHLVVQVVLGDMSTHKTEHAQRWL